MAAKHDVPTLQHMMNETCNPPMREMRNVWSKNNGVGNLKFYGGMSLRMVGLLSILVPVIRFFYGSSQNLHHPVIKVMLKMAKTPDYQKKRDPSHRKKTPQSKSKTVPPGNCMVL
jgi:hypothetical protein